MNAMSRIQRKLKELLDGDPKLHDFGPRGNPEATAVVKVDGHNAIVLAGAVLVGVHTRVMITCVSESGGCCYHCDVGIPYGKDPEVELRSRLSELRSNWFSVHFTTATAEGGVE